jgi:hypothetical protein
MMRQTNVARKIPDLLRCGNDKKEIEFLIEKTECSGVISPLFKKKGF